VAGRPRKQAGASDTYGERENGAVVERRRRRSHFEVRKWALRRVLEAAVREGAPPVSVDETEAAMVARGSGGAGGLHQFIHGGRLELRFEGRQVKRAVFSADIVRRSEIAELERYMAERVPYFYKDPRDIADSFGEGHFLQAVNDLLGKLPSSQSFRESHFGEILAGVYGEEILGLKLLYSKLTMLTSENANAYKMDLLFYRPGKTPAEFVFAEVKSSPKHADDGLPARHDKSCFPSLFSSFKNYKDKDRDFDLALIRERIKTINTVDAEAIRDALRPHSPINLRYAGVCVIDQSTRDENEASLLGTRANDKEFDVELLCVAEVRDVAEATYKIFDGMRP
jgi:hypothetical protein